MNVKKGDRVYSDGRSQWQHEKGWYTIVDIFTVTDGGGPLSGEKTESILTYKVKRRGDVTESPSSYFQRYKLKLN